MILDTCQALWKCARTFRGGQYLFLGRLPASRQISSQAYAQGQNTPLPNHCIFRFHCSCISAFVKIAARMPKPFLHWRLSRVLRSWLLYQGIQPTASHNRNRIKKKHEILHGCKIVAMRACWLVHCKNHHASETNKIEVGREVANDLPYRVHG